MSLMTVLAFVAALIPGILVMNAVRVLTDHDHLLEAFRRWFPTPDDAPFLPGGPLKATRINDLRVWLSKPMWACEYCTSSIWGTLTFWSFAVPVAGLPWWTWPLYCLALAGLRFELNSFIEHREVTVRIEDERTPEPLLPGRTGFGPFSDQIDPKQFKP